MLNMTEVRKGLYPFPVFEAHFSDGTVSRLSIWSHKDKTIDADYGRRCCLKLTANRGKRYSHGFVEWQGVKVPETEAAQLYRPVKARGTRADFKSLAEKARAALQSLGCNDSEILDALAAVARK